MTTHWFLKIEYEIISNSCNVLVGCIDFLKNPFLKFGISGLPILCTGLLVTPLTWASIWCATCEEPLVGDFCSAGEPNMNH